MTLRIALAVLALLSLLTLSACLESEPEEGNVCHEPGATTTDPQGNTLVCGY